MINIIIISTLHYGRAAVSIVNLKGGGEKNICRPTLTRTRTTEKKGQQQQQRIICQNEKDNSTNTAARDAPSRLA